MKNLLANAIASIATSVIETMDARKEIASARRDMFDYCERNGHHVTEVMYNDPCYFMEQLKAAQEAGTVKLKFKFFNPYYDRQGHKCRTNMERIGNIITIHSGPDKF
jgi:hypothetical protein